MSRLVRIAELVEDHGKSESSILTSAHIYKREHNSFPDWYIKEPSGAVFVDLDKLEFQSKSDMKAWELNTDPEYGLYWVLRLLLGYSDQKIAKHCASKSYKFTNISSWKQYMQYNMFNVPSDTKFKRSLSMNQDFFLIASKWVYLHIKLGKISKESKF